jgi:hypothetical protein
MNRRELLTEIKRLPEKGSLQTYDQLISALSQQGSSSSSTKGSKRKQSDDSTVSSNNNMKKRSVESTMPSTYFESLPNSNINRNIISSQTIASHNPEQHLQQQSSQQPQLYQPPRTMSKLTMNIGYGKTYNYPPSFSTGMIGSNYAPRSDGQVYSNQYSYNNDSSALSNQQQLQPQQQQAPNTGPPKLINPNQSSNDLNSLDDIDVLDLFSGDIPHSIHGTPINEEKSLSGEEFADCKSLEGIDWSTIDKGLVQQRLEEEYKKFPESF